MTLAAAELRSDSRRTRKQILRTATELSRKQGFESIRMADIARQVGCSRATVYNHFANRDQLLEAMCTEYLQGYLLILVQVKAWARPDNTVFEVLRETVAAELRWRVAHAPLRGALDSAKGMGKDFYVRENARIDEAMLTWFGAIYAASQEQGLLREAGDLEIATRAIYAMSDYVVAGFPVRTPPDEIDRVADEVARMQWHALYTADPDGAPPFGSLDLKGLEGIVAPGQLPS